ncbi:hypothetical protein WG66_010443 [Moniliophthora roreri]|nr:hypothetical protein WG66_010443 [Moniliophthora roreri]
MDTDQESVSSNATAEVRGMLETPSSPQRAPTPSPVPIASSPIKRKNEISDEAYNEICRQRTRNHLRTLQERERMKNQELISSASPRARDIAGAKLRVLEGFFGWRRWERRGPVNIQVRQVPPNSLHSGRSRTEQPTEEAPTNGVDSSTQAQDPIVIDVVDTPSQAPAKKKRKLMSGVDLDPGLALGAYDPHTGLVYYRSTTQPTTSRMLPLPDSPPPGPRRILGGTKTGLGAWCLGYRMDRYSDGAARGANQHVFKERANGCPKRMAAAR